MDREPTYKAYFVRQAATRGGVTVWLQVLFEWNSYPGRSRASPERQCLPEEPSSIKQSSLSSGSVGVTC